VDSPDFTTKQAAPPLDLAQVKLSSINLPVKTHRSIEEHTRLALACASTTEWFLSAISSILQGCKESSEAGGNDVEGLRTSVQTALSSSLDLLASAGTAIQDGTLASALALGELSVARRDAYIRKLPHISSSLKDRLRCVPLVEKSEPVVLPEEGSSDLFRGLSGEVKEDLKSEAAFKSTELILKAYYKKPDRQFKRPHSPKRSFPAKRPRNEPAPATVTSSTSQPFPRAPVRGRSRVVNHSVAPMAHVVEVSPVLGNEDADMGRAPLQCLVRPVGA